MDGGTGSKCRNVVGIKVFEAEGFSGVIHDSFDNGLAGDGAVIRDVVVHATVGFTAEDSAGVEETTFIKINSI